MNNKISEMKPQSQSRANMRRVKALAAVSALIFCSMLILARENTLVNNTKDVTIEHPAVQKGNNDPHQVRGITAQQTKDNSSSKLLKEKKPAPLAKKIKPKSRPPKHPTVTGWLVNTNSCMIPDYKPWDLSFAPFLRKEKSFKGCKQSSPVRIEQVGNKLVILQKHSTSNSLCKFDCCYRSIKRADGDLSDRAYSLGKIAKCFNGRSEVEVHDEFVRVQCRCLQSGRKLIYEDMHVFFIPPSLHDQRSTSTSPTLIETATSAHKAVGERLNMYIFGMDSISRLNFRRYLPRIEQIMLDEFDAVPLLGYTKVGLNTFPNMVPMLSGFYEDQIGISAKEAFLDDHPFIWKDFAALDYISMFNEDTGEISTFNYHKKGFYKQPTDYYLRPLNLALEKSKYIRYSKTHCINQRSVLDLQLDWQQQFMSLPAVFSQFAFIFSSTLSHIGPLSYIKHLEPSLENFFQWYRLSPRYNSSIMIFFSDHGQRFGDVMKYELGDYESRTPFFYLLLPPWYGEKYPERVSNLRHNSRRLTSVFDVYATLQQIVQDAGAAPLSPPRDKGVSLFLPVPAERSCKDAGIPEHWCLCHAQKPVSVKEMVIQRAAKSAVAHINGVLLRNVTSLCAPLHLQRVTDAYQKQQHDAGEGPTETPPNLESYVLKFVTVPGSGHFEAIVQTSVKEAVVKVDDISRLSAYKGQSDCLERSKLSSFCFCQDLLSKT